MRRIDTLNRVLQGRPVGQQVHEVVRVDVIVNYDGFYDCLLRFVETMQGHGTVGAGEYDQMVVKNTNEEVVEYLREYYQI